MTQHNSVPTITLKRGKTQLQIKNAAAILKKMGEFYPEPEWPWSKKQSEEDKIKMIKWKEAATDWFKNEFFANSGDFEVIINEPESTDISLIGKIEVQKEEPEDLYSTKNRGSVSYKELTDTEKRTVNKNAYEIRTEVLQMALHWVQYKHESESSQPLVIDDDEVLNVANKFYKFVENRR